MDRLTKKQILVLIVVLIATLFVRLIPLVPPEMRLITHVTDDSYYLYCIADHFVNGQGISFDGVSPTSTARPLYIWMLAGLEIIFGYNILPQVAYLFGALADTLTAFLIFRFLRKSGISFFPSLLGMCFYAFSARILYSGLNGMETPFAILAITCLLNLYPTTTDTNRKKTLLAVSRGVAIAAMLLLRLDYIFMAGSACVAELIICIRNKRLDWLYVGAVAGVLMLPWLIWTITTTGRLMPPSGDALTMIFGAHFTPGLRGLLDRATYFYYVLNNPFHTLIFLFQFNLGVTLSTFIISSATTLYIIINHKSIKWYSLLFILSMFLCCILSFVIDSARWAGALFVICYLLFAAIYMYMHNNQFKQILHSIAPVAIGLLLMIVYYAFIRSYFRGWNMIEGEIFVAIILGSVVAVFMKKKRGWIYVSALTIWVIITNIIIASPNIPQGFIPWQERLYNAAQWVKAETPPDTVVAAANGGIIQWYGERTLVDTAGIEDINAYHALKDKKLYRYLQERNVKYIIDPKEWLFEHYVDYWGVDINEKVTPIYYTDSNVSRPYPMNVNFLPIIYELK